MGYIHEHKDITIPLIIHYYLLRAFRTQIFPLNHNVRFLPCQLGRWHILYNGTR